MMVTAAAPHDFWWEKGKNKNKKLPSILFIISPKGRAMESSSSK
jgi:hypothetical protein